MKTTEKLGCVQRALCNIDINTHSLILYCLALLGKLIVQQLIKKFYAFRGTVWFITLFLVRNIPQSPCSIITISHNHHIPQSPYPANTISHNHHIPQSPYPAITISRNHPIPNRRIPQSPYPAIAISRNRHIP